MVSAAQNDSSHGPLQRARRYIARCPRAISGSGGHDATYRVAAILVNGFGLSEAEALTLLEEWNVLCEPPWSAAELLHKIQSASRAQHLKPDGHLLASGELPTVANPRPQRIARPQNRPPTKTAFRPMVLKRIAAKTSAILDIMGFVTSASPVAVPHQDSASVLRFLYPAGSGEKVIVFSRLKSQGQLLWEADKGKEIASHEFPTGPDGVWFLPQPVSGDYHPNPRQGGKLSRRSEESVIAWRYLLLESDKANRDDWLRCLVQLPLRISSICDSGGISIHALVNLSAASKQDWDSKVAEMKTVLVTLGACPGSLSAVRTTRLPQAWRGNRLQRLLYLNPTPVGTPIISQARVWKGVQ